MIRVYIAEHLAEAHGIRNRLQENGISAHVFNEFSNGAVGELPFTHTWPEVWVENDRDEPAALAVIEACKQVEVVEGESACRQCGQMNPMNFEICWNCSTQLVAD